ncbi:MAG: DUF4153 domain-containing protein [Bacteroidales bacterium]|nr:DUF4153 domain-containing protein [Bacteroidales bacterium]
MKLKISFPELLQTLKQSFGRFPEAVGFLFLLTILSLILFNSNHLKYDDYDVAVYYLSTATFLSIMLSLWSEAITSIRKVIICKAVAHTALIADALWLQFGIPNGGFDTELFLAHTAAIFSMLLGIAYLPFWKQKDDVPSWNFVRRLGFNFIICVIVGNIMASGLTLLVQGMHSLLNLDIDHGFGKFLLSLAIFIPSLTLTISLWISRIPRKDEMYDDSLLQSTFLSKVTRFLFIPLIGTYLLLLYIYLAKIIVNWQLPNGEVSLYVSFMMLGIIIVRMLLYPVLVRQTATYFERLASHWLPILALPLLLLMTIGIVRRLNDYGITPSRLYVATLNIWFYGVCIWMIFKQYDRIHWIPLSFGALFLLTSTQPCNYTAISRWNMLNRIEAILAEYEPEKLPMSDRGFKNWIKSLPEERQEKTYSAFQYLSKNGYKEDIKPWLKSDVYLWRDFKNVTFESNEQDRKTPQRNDSNLLFKFQTDIIAQVHTIPKGCHRFAFTACPGESLSNHETDSIYRISIPYYNGDSIDFLKVDINVPALKRLQNEGQEEFMFNNALTGKTPVFFPLQLSLTRKGEMVEVSYHGNVFMP